MSGRINHCDGITRKFQTIQRHRPHRKVREQARHTAGLVAEALEHRLLLSLPAGAGGEAPAWAPFASVLPAGSLVYQSSVTGTLASDTEATPLPLNLEAGQSLSLLLQPSSGLRPQLEVRDPSGAILASSTGGGAGQAAWVQSLALPTGGTYQVLVRSASGSGDFTLQATLNAALETEPLAASSNNTPDTAQDLDGSFLSLGGNAYRAAILGSTDDASVAPLLQADFTQDAQGFTVDNAGGGLWHLSIGHGSEAGHSASQSFYYGRNETADGGGNYNTGTRNSGSLLSPVLALPAGQSASLSFNYLLRTESGVGYDLAQLQINAGAGWNTLASYNRIAESSTWKSTSVDLSAYAGKTVQLRWLFDTKDAMSNSFEGWYVDDVKVQCTAPRTDYYSLTLQAGETATLALKKLASGTVHMAITDAAGTVLAEGAAASGNVDEILSGFQAPAAGRYYVRLTSSSALPYQLLALRNAAFDCEPNNSVSGAQDLSNSLTALGNISSGDSDFYSMRLSAGERIRFTTHTPGDGTGGFANSLDPRLELYDAGGWSIASNDNGAADGRNASLVYQASQSGTYKVRIVPANGTGGEYVLQMESLPPVTATPAAPDLSSDSDTGVSNSDNLTRLSSGLQFVVGNTLPGATVMLYADGQLIGRALAEAKSTLITCLDDNLLSDGVHQFTVTQQLPNQEVSALSATVSVTIDTLAPAAPASPSLLASSDTGISGSDRITNDSTPSFSIPVGAYYRVYRQGTKLSGDYESNSTYTAPVQAEGSWDYALTAVDAAGNESPLGAALNITIDTTAPAQPAAPDLDAASDSGFSNSDNITRYRNSGLILNVSAQPYYRVYRDGSLISEVYQAGSTYTTFLSDDGAYLFTLSQVDAAGNVSSPSDPLRVILDSSSTASVPDLQPASDSGVSNFDDVTNVTAPTFDVVATEPGVFYLQVDGDVNGIELAVSTAGRYSISFSAYATSFAPEQRYAACNSWGIEHIKTADFNGDGKLDLIVDNDALHTLTVLLGNGDGTFDSPTVIAPTPRVQFYLNPIPADVNGDGKIDILTAGQYPALMLGNGDGTFQPPCLLDESCATWSALATDVNGDGKIDVLVPDGFPEPDGPNSRLLVLLGNGDGTFQKKTYAVPGKPMEVRATDLNSDGKQDLAVAIGRGGVCILLGNGDGTFTSGQTLAVDGSDRMEFADFNKDGNRDLVIIQNAIQVLLGNGDGTFRDPLTVPPINAASPWASVVIVGGVAVADADRDGTLDLAIASRNVNTGADIVYVFSGRGDGTFQSPRQFDTGPRASDIVAGDFNGDGLPDLATSSIEQGDVSVLLARSSKLTDGIHSVTVKFTDLAGNPSLAVDGLKFTVDTTPPDAPAQPDLAAESDSGVSNTDNITNDTTPTLVLPKDGYYRVYCDGVLVSGNYVTGSFTTQPLSDGVHALAIAAMDAAGNVSALSAALNITIDTVAPATPAAPDLDAGSDSGVSNSDNITKDNTPTFNIPLKDGYFRFYCDGKQISGDCEVGSQYTLATQPDGRYSYALAAVDVAGNRSALITGPLVTIDTVAKAPSMPDLDAASDSGVSSSDNLTRVMEAVFRVNAGEAGTLHLKGEDWTFDTSTIAGAAGMYPMQVSLSSVNMVPTATVKAGVIFDDIGNIQIADFNCDGYADLAMAGVNKGVVMQLGNGDGTFQPAKIADSSTAIFRIGDLNEDGKPDLILGGFGNSLRVRLGRGDGSFDASQAVQNDMVAGLVSTADFNNDGHLDILALSPPTGGTNKWRIFLGNGDATFRTGPETPRIGNMIANTMRLGDINGDGATDLLYSVMPDVFSGAYLLVMHFGNGDGTLRPAISTEISDPRFNLGDFDEDGKMDLILSGSLNPTLMLGNGDGTFTAWPAGGQLSHYQGLTVADFNNDGHADVAAGGLSESRVWVSLGDGTGDLGVAVPFPAGREPRYTYTGDLNADGKPDLLCYNATDFTISVFLNAITDVSDGQHRLTAWMEDLAGNVSPVSNPLAFTLDTKAPRADIVDVTPDPRSSGIDTITIRFSEPVAGFEPADLILSRDGGPNLLAASQVLETPDNMTWTLFNLMGLTSATGTYTLSFNPVYTGIVDLAGNPLALGASETFTVNYIPNTPPVLTPIGDRTVEEGSTLTFTLKATDNDLPAQTLNFSLDKSAPEGARIDPATGVFTWTPTGKQTGVFKITAGVRDDGIPFQFVSQTFTVTVKNLPPQVDAGADTRVFDGHPFVSAGTFSDPGRDVCTATVDYGDGSGIQPLVLSEGGFALNHSYSAIGHYTVTVSVTDSEGAVGTDQCVVTVGDAPLKVMSLTATISGFDLKLNRAADIGKVNLYDGTDAAVDLPDLSITGQNSGSVAGSLVWDAATNTAHFIKTGGILAPDTYSVTLYSRADGWVDGEGELLDGDGDGAPGGDYRGSFTAAAITTPIVSLPDFARGPGQSVDLPATKQGIPVRISEAAGTRSLSMGLAYNPKLLKVDSATLPSGLPSDWKLFVRLRNPGWTEISLAGTTPLPAGARDLVIIQASVPADAPYGASAMLELRKVRINECDPFPGDTAIQSVAYLGDASGNRSYSGQDASLIAGVVARRISGFDACPLIDPTMIADASGDGSLSGLDASYVAQKSAGIFRPEIPDLPKVAAATPLAARAAVAGEPAPSSSSVDTSLLSLRTAGISGVLFGQKPITADLLSVVLEN